MLGFAAAAACLLGDVSWAQQQAFTQPYWTQRPVIESLGRAQVEVAPNRAIFSVSFQATARESDAAVAEAVAAAQRAVAAMRARVGDAARIASNVSIETNYQQYRDREGERIENERGDRIESYTATATLGVTLEDISKAAEARAAAMAARPQSADNIHYGLVLTAALERQAYEAAVADAAARARGAAQAAGARLGQLLVVQEGQGPCLGAWYAQQPGVANDFAYPPPPPPPPAMATANEQVVVTASRREDQITVGDIERLNLPSQSEPMRIESRVCAVYAVGP